MSRVFAEGNIECVEKLLKPAKRVLKVGMPIKHDAFERRVDLWNKIRMNYDSYLDEDCGSFLKDLDQHFRSTFDGGLLVLAASFKENGEFFGAADIFSEEEIELYRRIVRYDIFDLLSVADLRKKLVQKDDKVLDLLRDYYVSMDSWVDAKLNDSSLRLTLRYYLKKKWDGYRTKLNEAVSSSVMELDWLKSLIKSWEAETEGKVDARTKELGAEKAQVEARVEELYVEKVLTETSLKQAEAEKLMAESRARTISTEKALAEEQMRQASLQKAEAEARLESLARENADAGARIQAIESEKAGAEARALEMALEKERAEQQANEMAAEKEKAELKLRELTAESDLLQGKGSRYVKLEEVKQYELNFIGRIEHRLGNTITFSGKTYKVDALKEVKQVDTSHFSEGFGLTSLDLKNLPENRALLASFIEKKLIGKKERYNFQALFSARVERYAENGYDIDPLGLKEVNACLVDSRDEAREKGNSGLLCLASPTGFEESVGNYINSEDFHRNFLSRYLSVCLLDLDTGKQLYNPNDKVAKEFAKLCEMVTETEKAEKLKLSLADTVEDVLLMQDYVVFGDIAKGLGSLSDIKPIFYDYAEENGLKVRFVEDVGLVMMKNKA
ncbi:MAG: hypothetical protein PHW56_10345 [Methanosarcinaceae archaeon]|nr:hypothetical protein [Methanosarcinaceae archaeon]